MNKALTFQDMIMTLHRFWNDQGCLLMNPHDIETGAGTMNPMTTLRTLGPEEWNELCPYGMLIAKVRQLGDSTWEVVEKDGC